MAYIAAQRGKPPRERGLRDPGDRRDVEGGRPPIDLTQQKLDRCEKERGQLKGDPDKRKGTKHAAEQTVAIFRRVEHGRRRRLRNVNASKATRQLVKLIVSGRPQISPRLTSATDFMLVTSSK